MSAVERPSGGDDCGGFAPDELFRAVFEESALGMSLTAPDGRLLRVNASLCAMLGYSREELQGGKWQSISHPDDVADTREHVRALLAGERDKATFDKRYLDGAGRAVWTHVTTRLHRDSRGEAVCFLTQIEDIRERKEVELALRASEERNRELIRGLLDAYVRVDMSGRIIEHNAAFRELVGRPSEELALLTYRDLTPERWHAMEAKIVDELLLRSGHSEVYEKEYRRGDGTLVPVELRLSLVRDDAGHPTAMWATVRDVSHRSRAAEASRASAARLDLAQRIARVGDWSFDLASGALEWSRWPSRSTSETRS